MASSKTISLRIDYELYNQILVECEKKGITVTEWVERKIAIANSVNDTKKEILRRLALVEVTENFDSRFNKARLLALKQFVDEEL
jgi:hypothetical protein